jgi:DUF1707 SHOCT-like domain
MTDDRPPLPISISTADRDRVIQVLGDHFAQDRLALDEYERRVELALRAHQAVELEDLTRDLPARSEGSASRSSEMIAHPVETRDLAPVTGRRTTLIAVMSGSVRRGRWRVPARLRAFALMGGVEIDLREAEFTSPVTDIYAVAVMGGVVVRVPPHVRVETEGMAIMGGFDDQVHLPETGGASAPVVRLRGFALLGGVGTTTKDE